MRASCCVVLGLAACGDNLARVDAPTTDAAPACPAHGTNIYLRQIAAIEGTITMIAAPAADDRLFVEQANGKIWIIANGVVLPEPFLDVTAGISPPYVGGAGQELGLLGLAFDPDFATNRTLFINYTATQADPSFPYLDVTMRVQARADDPNTADMSTAAVVLAIPDFSPYHNGGMLEFGADGYLYVSDGDGGIDDATHNTAQDPFSLLGKIHRLDVDHPTGGKAYAIPPDNPFADGLAGAPEVYVMGLRNPWRFTFDTATNDLWIGDVGQDAIEEVDVLHPGHIAGANLGWNMYEGNTCYTPPCDPTGKVFPADSRTHASGWCAVIGGEVYRGACYPDLVGDYFYADYCAGGMSRARLHGDDSLEVIDTPMDVPVNPSMIHADARGEIYVADLYGNIFHLEAVP